VAPPQQWMAPASTPLDGTSTIRGGALVPWVMLFLVEDVAFGVSSHVYDAIYAVAGKDYAAKADTLDQVIQARCPGVRTLLDVDRSWRADRTSILHLPFLSGTGEGIAHVTETHRLSLFTDLEYRAALENAGLVVESVPSPHPDRDRYIGTRPR